MSKLNLESLMAALVFARDDPDHAEFLRKMLSSVGVGGVYSDLEIREAVEAGHIVIHPLNPESIRGSSVDVTLGEWFYPTDRIDNQAGYNPFDREDVLRYFGEAKRAVPHSEWSEKHKGMTFKGIPEDHPIIVLHPGERILAHTHEFIGINPPGTTEMRARSTWGRNGIVVCKDAGWGDPGYINRWTYEVQNDNSEVVPLPVGERIAQIIFHHTGPCERNYGVGGKYQGGITIEEIVAKWRPEQLLPQAYKDQRKLPLPVDSILESMGGGSIERQNNGWRPEPDWDDDGRVHS